MKLDFVDWGKVRYTSIQHERGDYPTLNGNPHIITVTDSNERYYGQILEMAEVLQNYPDFLLKHLKFFNFEASKRVEHENITLRDLLTEEGIRKLYHMYEKNEELTTAYRDKEKFIKLGGHKGITRQRKELEADGMFALDWMQGSVEKQLIRQHITYPFVYSTKKGFPKSFRIGNDFTTYTVEYDNKEEEAYTLKNPIEISPNNKTTIFPVRRFELELIK